MMDLVPLAAMAALVISIVNFVKAFKAKVWNSVVTQLAVWGGGIAVVVLAAQTDFADTIFITDDMSLGSLNGWSQVFAGLAFGSTATVVNEFKQAIDSSDSAKKPPFIP